MKAEIFGIITGDGDGDQETGKEGERDVGVKAAGGGGLHSPKSKKHLDCSSPHSWAEFAGVESLGRSFTLMHLEIPKNVGL
jgi:hypothetical protein